MVCCAFAACYTSLRLGGPGEVAAGIVSGQDRCVACSQPLGYAHLLSEHLAVVASALPYSWRHCSSLPCRSSAAAAILASHVPCVLRRPNGIMWRPCHGLSRCPPDRPGPAVKCCNEFRVGWLHEACRPLGAASNTPAAAGTGNQLPTSSVHSLVVAVLPFKLAEMCCH